MIRRRFSSLVLTRVIALLAMALVARGDMRAAEAASHSSASVPAAAAPKEAPVTAAPSLEAAKVTPSPAPASAPAEAETPASSPAASATPGEKKSAKAEPKRAVDEIHGLLNLGPSLTDRGDFDAAEIAFRQVLNAPNVETNELKTALLGLARMHRKKGELTKAVAIYERYLKDYIGDDRTPDALLELGRTLRDLGVYKLAIARFYSVLNSTLKLPTGGFDRYQVLAKTASFEIAETNFLAGDFAEAAKFYTRFGLLENLAPADRARAHFKIAYSRKLQGDLEGAVTTLRAYIDQWPDDENVPEARYLLAVTLREMKRPQEAFAATLELLRAEKSRVATDPRRWAYWQRRTGNQLANDFFETGDTLNAHAIYSGLLELSPDPAWRLPIVYQLALCYERLGIVERARTSYQSIVEAAGPTPSPDIAELAKMAAWRMEHLEWRDRVTAQVNKFFDTNTGKQAASALALPRADGTPSLSAATGAAATP